MAHKNPGLHPRGRKSKFLSQFFQIINAALLVDGGLLFPSVTQSATTATNKNPSTPSPAVCYTMGRLCVLRPLRAAQPTRPAYSGSGTTAACIVPPPRRRASPSVKTNKRGLLSPLRYAPFRSQTRPSTAQRGRSRGCKRSGTAPVFSGRWRAVFCFCASFSRLSVRFPSQPLVFPGLFSGTDTAIPSAIAPEPRVYRTCLRMLFVLTGAAMCRTAPVGSCDVICLPYNRSLPETIRRLPPPSRGLKTV
jgi:hypothetical protein